MQTTHLDYINKITTILPEEKDPFIVQEFVSLEGEGGNNSIGIPTLFLRLGICNCACKFCDTKFSIPDNKKARIAQANSNELIQLLSKHSETHRNNVHSLSITGGEPLLHMRWFKRIVINAKSVFRNLDMLIIETNGNLLYKEENCKLLLEQIRAIEKMGIKTTLSISPKLNGKVAYGNKMSNEALLEVYKVCLDNWHTFFEGRTGLQLKFVHSEELKIENEPIMDYAIDNKIIGKENILVMGLTPDDPFKNMEEWNKSQIETANYALSKVIRYSPRIHLDLKLD